MKTILFITYLVSSLVAISAKCHSCFLGVCYQRTKIFGGHQISGQLAIDRTENIVYFHFSNNQNKDYTASFNFNNAMYSEIPEISFTFARAVDQNTRDVYMSGTKGIYKYNPNTNSTVLHGLADKIIWHMYHTDKLYYNVYSVAGLNVFENRRSSAISALAGYKIDDFVVDKLGDIYFLSEMNMYRLKKNAKQPSKFGDLVYSLSTDKNGNVYFTRSATCGVYKLDYSNDRMVDVGAFGGGTPLNFVFDDSNNVIYHDADTDSLYYLMPTYGRCKVTTRKTGSVSKKLKVTVTDEGQDGLGLVEQPSRIGLH